MGDGGMRSYLTAGKNLCLTVLLLLLLLPAQALAEITFIVSAEGTRGFSIEGDDINITAQVELTVVYDSTLLANPKVTVDGGTVSNVMDANPGTLIFDANQGSETTPSFLVHLSFDRAGDAPGGIFSVTGKIREQDGSLTPSSTMPNPSTPAVLGWVSPDAETEPSRGAAESSTSGGWLDPASRQMSVPQRFREYTGERTLQGLVALFARDPRSTLVQDPPVVIADGTARVRISFPWKRETGGTPDIALSDAKLINSGAQDGDCWAVTAQPNQGSWNASLLIKVAERLVEFPLVVAPPLRMPKGIQESTFLAALDRFLADQAGAATRDDPAGRALNEYVFTANYLAGPGKETATIGPATAGLVANCKSSE